MKEKYHVEVADDNKYHKIMYEELKKKNSIDNTSHIVNLLIITGLTILICIMIIK
jgi:hypothetical protein